MKQIIYYLIAGTRGGETRAEIINSIKNKPMNANMLSRKLKYDYKTIQHHLNILVSNKVLEKRGKYGGVYFITDMMEKNMEEFDKIWKRFGNNSGKSI